MPKTFSIGERIEQELRSRGIQVKDFAEALGLQRPNAYRLFRAHSIDTEILYRVCEYLHCDLFREYSERLNFDTRIIDDTE